MKRPPKGTKVGPYAPPPADGVWSEKDDALLQQLMDPLFHKPKINPLGMLGSEARGLCCAPKSEVFDRLVAFVSTINVMSGLVLSAIASLATAPLVVEALPSNKRFLGSLFNVLAFVSVATQICVVMFSTYMLFLVYCHGHSPSAIYRALVHSQTLIGACMLGVYFPLLLWLAMIVTSAQIYFAFWPKWLCTFAVPLVYAAFHFLFTYSYARAFPRAMWGWHAVTAPWLFWSGRVRADVERVDAALRAAAEQGALAGKDDDHDGVVDAPRARTPEEAQLDAFVRRALPEREAMEAEDARRAALVRALAVEGLVVPRLADAARQPGGFAVVMGLLDFSQAGSGIELSRGERLALATALMKEATPVDAYS